MKFDEFLFQHLGEMGRYQRIQFLLVCLPTVIVSMHALSWTFAAVHVPYRCAFDNEKSDAPYYKTSNLLEYKTCKDQSLMNVNLTRKGEKGVTCFYDECHFANDSKSVCSEHVFDHSKVTYSAIERWEITCDRGYIKATVQAVYYVGPMIGSMTFGVLGDKIGRKKVFFIAIILQIICGLLIPLAPCWPVYALFRLGTGVSHPGIFVIAVVIGMELVGPKYRKLASVITGIFFGLGQVILGIEAMFITDYRCLHVVIASPALLFISYWWIVPESARWLVNQKRYEEADQVLRKAAKTNGVTLPDRWWEQLDDYKAADANTEGEGSALRSNEPVSSPSENAKAPEAEQKYGAMDLFRTPELRRRTIVVFFLWPVVSMIYYGMTMKADVLGGDIYINFIFAAAVEVPALILVYLFIDRAGRRIILAIGYFLAGACLILNWIFTELGWADSNWVAIPQMLITKGSITATYAAIYTYSPELFPTAIRNTAMGCCSTIARVGAVTASYVAMWVVERFGKVFMIVPFGVMSVLAAILTILFLPETMGKHLPETIQEIEAGAKSKKGNGDESLGQEMQPLKISRCSMSLSIFAATRLQNLTTPLRFTGTRFYSNYTFKSFKNVSSLRPLLKQWIQTPVKYQKACQSARLLGLGFSFTSFLPRKLSCEPKASTLSRRTDHLREAGDQPEPKLSLSDLWGLIRPYFGWLLAAIVCAFLTAVINIKVPLYLGDLINAMVELIKGNVEWNVEFLKPHAIRLLTCYVAQAVLTFANISFLTILGERMATDLRVQLFRQLLLLDMQFFDSQKTGELTSRLNSDVQEFKSSFKLTVAQGLKTIAQTIGCVMSLIYISPKLTLLTVSIVPGVVFFGAIFGALLRTLSRRAQAQSAIAASVAEEAFSNIQVVKAYATEELETKLFRQETEKANGLNEELGMGIGLFQGATNLFLNGIVLGVLYGGAQMIKTGGEMSPGALMSFLVSAQTIQKSLSQLSIVFGNALKGWTAAARVFQFLNLQPIMRTDDGVCIPYHTLWGEIRFEDVGFSYPNRPGHKVKLGFSSKTNKQIQVFDRLNLTIPAGQVIALCGPSGEGKTTITALMERFYDPQEGRITLDGQDLRTLNLEWLRGQVVGLISQEPVLFAMTIEENIRYGRPNATDQEVREAAVMAHADEFIGRFPQGYKTLVGQRGQQLSGGQKQVGN
ncbi:hypothetical protein WR25_22122 isoform B [Diploscapter pachys]|uniref:Major facilitator superfamily (MFS) profile domain-containing protein n=1 Tax=Diploscapter pachys TaxID=2018661 RepID=A0A2A2M0H8_9BILA|nr:hypothetical protein WR25_22122 isoform B [Diploscapter pachys]